MKVSCVKRSELVLPGVGAFGACMRALTERGFDQWFASESSGNAVVGVCVGMQMLFEESEEFGATSGLGLLRGRVRRFRTIWWCRMSAGINSSDPSKSVVHGVADESFFYFVHSFFCEPT